MQKISKTVFIFSSISLLIFISGFLGFVKILPYESLLVNLRASLEVLDETVNNKPFIIRKKKYERHGAKTELEDQVEGQGLTALQGWFSEGAKVKLINYQGEVLNSWDLDFFRIWPNPTHFEKPEHIPQTRFNFHSQGMYLYPNGDLLASFARIGLVKMDRCGKVLWTLDRFTHHAVSVDEEGNIWVPAESSMAEVTDRILYKQNREDVLSVSKKPAYNNLILKLDANGKVLKEYSVLEKMIEAGIEDRILDSFFINPLDPTHVNDVEIVNTELAEKIDAVEAGDILVSLRQMHTLLIMSRDTGDIIWYRVGPWVRQHDPDVDEDGTISVYNNRSMSLIRKHEKPFSSIVKFDPATDQVFNLYPANVNMLAEGQKFFSDIMGTHQILPNQHILITEARAGRVFEVSESGMLVWEYIEDYSDKYSALIEAAQRFPDDYFTVGNWNCSAQ